MQKYEQAFRASLAAKLNELKPNETEAPEVEDEVVTTAAPEEKATDAAVVAVVVTKAPRDTVTAIISVSCVNSLSFLMLLKKKKKIVKIVYL